MPSIFFLETAPLHRPPGYYRTGEKGEGDKTCQVGSWPHPLGQTD